VGKPPKGYLDILVIDDDPLVRDIIGTALRGEGHQVVAVESAELGLEQLPYYTFEVAFLDHHLPGMEGLVLGEYLRQNNPRMQITIVTGDADERLERLARSKGIHVVEKPFDVDQLLDIVASYQHLEHERSAQQEARARGGWEVDVPGQWQTLPAFFEAPNVPQRIEELLARKIRTALDNIRFGADGAEDVERDRVAAYAGLIAAQVLGVHLPRQKDGGTLFEHYDAQMAELGKAPAFPNNGGAGGA